MFTLYEITVVPSLRPPGNLRKRLRNMIGKAYTEFKHASRRPGFFLFQKPKKKLDILLTANFNKQKAF